MPKRALVFLVAAATSVTLAACGSQGNDVHGQSADVEAGAQLFSDHCAGCHTLDVVGAQGSATKIKDRERVDGPNFNVRKECVQNVLYAIRNGGYSGAIMPENIVVGTDANKIAAFLQQYSGTQAKVAPGGSKINCATVTHP